MVSRARRSKGKDGRRRGCLWYRSPFTAAHLSPFSPGGAHHSAADVRRRRNRHLVLCVSIQRSVILPKPLGEAEPHLASVRISGTDLPSYPLCFQPAAGGTCFPKAAGGALSGRRSAGIAAMPQIGTVPCYLCRIKNSKDMAAKTMTYHELLHSVTFDEDVNFVPLPRFLIVECNLDY